MVRYLAVVYSLIWLLVLSLGDGRGAERARGSTAYNPDCVCFTGDYHGADLDCERDRCIPARRARPENCLH